MSIQLKEHVLVLMKLLKGLFEVVQRVVGVALILCEIDEVQGVAGGPAERDC